MPCFTRDESPIAAQQTTPLCRAAGSRHARSGVLEEYNSVLELLVAHALLA
jgi:hypothetical protein